VPPLANAEKPSALLLALPMLALDACRPQASSPHQDAGSDPVSVPIDAAAATAPAVAADAAGDRDAEEALAVDEARYCGVLQRAADQAAAQARAILADREPSLYEAEVLWSTTQKLTSPWAGQQAARNDPHGVSAILRADGIPERDWERFAATNAGAVERCCALYAARLESYGDLFPRIEAIALQGSTFITSVDHLCLPFGRLQRPIVLYDEEWGNCGHQVAVDGAGQVWTEGGCENGESWFCRDERLTSKGRARFGAALGRLRRAHLPVSDGGAPDCSHAEPDPEPRSMPLRKRTFELVEASGARRVWDLCPWTKLPRVFQDVIDVMQ
jgi:hypothetical protein